MAGAAAKTSARSVLSHGRREAPPNARHGLPTSPMRACSASEAARVLRAAPTGAPRPTASSLISRPRQEEAEVREFNDSARALSEDARLARLVRRPVKAAL